jgi:hypothetical protein
MTHSTPPRAVKWPSCHFSDFLQHMSDSGGPEWTWTWIETCSRFGVYYSGPEGILLARPVHSSLSEQDLMEFNDLDPESDKCTLDLTSDPDTWHILYGAGNPALFYDLCPYELEKVSFHRNKGPEKLKTYNFKQLKRRIHGK